MEQKSVYKARLRSKGQTTIPNQVREALNIEEGDDILFYLKEGRVYVERAQTIDPEQAWFWSERWQKLERKAQNDIENGRVVRHANIDDAIAALGGRESDADD